MSRPDQPAAGGNEEEEDALDADGDYIPDIYRDRTKFTANDDIHLKKGQQKAYNYIDQLRGFKLSPGVGKDGRTPYTRSINYGPGAKELVRLAAGLQKSMKQVNGTQTHEGAVNWVKKYKKGKNWEAFEADITGPNGKPDGIQEVIITDAKGNVKIINGYTLGASQYPWRAAYYTDHPTKEDQREHPFMQYKKVKMMTKDEPDENGNYQYRFPMPENYQNVRNKISPSKQFRQVVFTKIYNQFKDEIKAKGYDALGKSQLSARIFSYVFKILFEIPAICKLYNVAPENVRTTSEKDYKKYKNKDETKAEIKSQLNTVLTNTKKLAQCMAKTIHLIILALGYFANIQIDGNKIIYGIKVSDILTRQQMQTMITNEDATENTVLSGRNAYRNTETHQNAVAANRKLRQTRQKINEGRTARKTWLESPFYNQGREDLLMKGWEHMANIAPLDMDNRYTEETAAAARRASREASQQNSDDEDEMAGLELLEIPDEIEAQDDSPLEIPDVEEREPEEPSYEMPEVYNSLLTAEKRRITSMFDGFYIANNTYTPGKQMNALLYRFIKDTHPSQNAMMSPQIRENFLSYRLQIIDAKIETIMQEYRFKNLTRQAKPLVKSKGKIFLLINKDIVPTLNNVRNIMKELIPNNITEEDAQSNQLSRKIREKIELET